MESMAHPGQLTQPLFALPGWANNLMELASNADESLAESATPSWTCSNADDSLDESPILSWTCSNADNSPDDSATLSQGWEFNFFIF